MVMTNLALLGIRHTRCDGYNQDWVWDYWNRLYTNSGVKRTEIFFPNSAWTNWSLSNMVALARRHPAMMDAVEGPNETDAEGITYNGAHFPQGTILFQNDLYNAMKNDPQTTNLTVLAPTLADPTKTTNLIGCQLDYENMHSYANGSKADNALDVWWIPYANQIINPHKPIIASECGWHTAVNFTNNDQPGVSERAQGKYIPRLFGEYWNRGIVRAFTYELFDEGTNLLNSQQCYGLLHHDGTPKPAFTAERNMIALLNDPGAGTALSPPFLAGDPLDYTLSGNTNNVHHVLLEKRNGDFYLLLWQEVLSFDTATKLDLTNPPAAVTLTLPKYIASAVTYTFTDSGALVTNAPPITNNTLALNIPDSVFFVALSPVPFALKDNADSTGITIVGVWTSSTNVPGYYGKDYLFDSATGGGKSVQFTPNLPMPGYYDVYDRWTTNSNRATHVPIDVNSAAGTSTIYVNQQTNNGRWVYLGTFLFNAGANGNVTVRDDGANGNVIADAVEFICSTSNAWSLVQSLTLSNQTASVLSLAAPGHIYQLQRSTNVLFTAPLRSWTTNSPTSARFQLMDNFSDLSTPPSAAFYRLLNAP
ncbi:MAG: hypothetical protein C5B50_29115 [Verrucomicrobia bacterium]|nr:MAG: hypothetical protein C5B50_29115 [Verrucomicrobiota bacterium]